TPAAPYTDSTITGSSAFNQATTPAPITASTTLSGTAPSNSLPTPFAAGNTITIDGTTFTFVNTGSPAGTTGTNIDISDTAGPLLGKIQTIPGVAPTINATTGAITLHSGTGQDLNISVSSSAAAAFNALGFTSPVAAARGGGGTAGTGVVTGNDLSAFTNESISGGAVTAYNAAGTPVNLQMRWAKTDSASLGSGHQDTWNLFYQTSTTATGSQIAWVNSGTNFTFSANGSLASPTGSAISIPGVVVDGQSLGA